MSQIKIWYRNSEPGKIISTGKSVGELGESFFYSDVLPDDDEFYTIDQGPPQVLVRKSQSAIDSIIVARAQVADNYQQKHIDAKAQLTLNDLSGKTYAQVETFVNNNTSKVVLRKFGKILLALLKERDFSE